MLFGKDVICSYAWCTSVSLNFTQHSVPEGTFRPAKVSCFPALFRTVGKRTFSTALLKYNYDQELLYRCLLPVTIVTDQQGRFSFVPPGDCLPTSPV